MIFPKDEVFNLKSRQGLCQRNVKLALSLKWMLTAWCLVKASLREAADDPERRDGPLKAQPIPPAQASMGCATVRT